MTTPNLMTATSMVPAVLVSTQIAATTDQTLYTVAANKAVKIAQGSIANVSSNTVTVGLSIVPSGGTVGDGTHKVVPDMLLAPNDTLSLGDLIAGHVLGEGDKIAAKVSVAGAIDIVITGTVIS